MYVLSNSKLNPHLDSTLKILAVFSFFFSPPGPSTLNFFGGGGLRIRLISLNFFFLRCSPHRCGIFILR
jgi:hypothetical protein